MDLVRGECWFEQNNYSSFSNNIKKKNRELKTSKTVYLTVDYSDISQFLQCEKICVIYWLKKKVLLVDSRVCEG